MIRIEGLRKNFGKTTVLDALDLSLNAGDRTALIGANGAGKTTLIRCLLGEYTYQGTVLVNGAAPRSQRTAVLRDISFVPQLPPPLKMPVDVLLHYAANICAAPENDMRRVGTRLGLDFDEIGNRPFSKLSGGQKQKILIAIAMGRPVKTLIMDEPTANLDPRARQVFFDIMGEQLDRTMIISSHRLEEVTGMVNRVVELDHGKVVLDDKVEDVADPAARLRCHLGLKKADPAFARTMGEWGLDTDAQGIDWRGEIAGPDRLRFLGTLTRYAGILRRIHIDDARNAEGK